MERNRNRLKLFWSLQSRPVFFRVSLIMATFCEGGTVPTGREKLVMEVIKEVIESKHALTVVVGIGSS